MVDLVIVGSVALDSVKTPFGEKRDVLGGAASYSSVAASIFAKCGVVGVVGKDFPREHVDFLMSRGISVDGLEVVDGKTFRWAGYYEYDMNQAHTTDTQLNVFADFKPEIPSSYRNAKYLFLANIHPELQLHVLESFNDLEFVALDTMNLWIDTKKDELMKVISKVDMILINDAEIRQLMGTPNVVKAARALLKKGPKYVIVKKGENGAAMFNGGVCFVAAGYPLENLFDPTGAGDSFAGGLMGYIASTGDVSPDNIRKGIVYGSSIASYDVEDFSLDRLRKITKKDVEKRFEEFRDLVGF